jgi:hypothetical protein
MRQVPFNTPDGCTGVGMDIHWQQGPIVDNRANGSTVEQPIRAAIARLVDLDQQVPCEENRQAIERLHDALAFLDRRTRDRATRGVMGTQHT